MTLFPLLVVEQSSKLPIPLIVVEQSSNNLNLILLDGELLDLKDELELRRMLIEFIYTLHAFVIIYGTWHACKLTMRHPLSLSTKFLKKIYYNLL